MRIAFLVDRFPVISETFILRQITGLLDMGHEVDIYANRPPDSRVLHAQVRRYDLLRRTTYLNRRMPAASGYWEMPVWPIWGKTWLHSSAKPILNAGRVARALPVLLKCLITMPRLTLQVLDPREYGYQARSLSSLYRLSTLHALRGRYDVLHAHFGPAGNTFRFARSLWSAPLVVSFHGYDFSSLPKKEGDGIYSKLFSVADMVTVNSEHTRRRVESLGCSTSKIRKLSMGVDLAEFSFRERSPRQGEGVRLLTVGRLVEKKGIEYSIRAVAAALERYQHIRYDIVGEGPLRPALEALSRQLGVEESVFFHGGRDSGYVKRMMDAAHLFVLASVTASDGGEEGQGLVLQEAQASGLPVLATDHNGFSESIVPGRSGYLVPERDSDSLAQCLLSLIGHPEAWAEMGREGRRHVEERYDIRKLNAQLVELYREAIKAYQVKRGKVERV